MSWIFLSVSRHLHMPKCQNAHNTDTECLRRQEKRFFFFVFRFWKQQIHDVTIRISHVCLWCRMIRDYLMVSLFSLGDGREKKNERTMSEASKEKHDISPFRMRSPCERYILHARRTHFTLVIWKTQIMCPVERTLSHWERYLTAERRKKKLDKNRQKWHNIERNNIYSSEANRKSNDVACNFE